MAKDGSEGAFEEAGDTPAATPASSGPPLPVVIGPPGVWRRVPWEKGRGFVLCV